MTYVRKPLWMLAAVSLGVGCEGNLNDGDPALVVTTRASLSSTAAQANGASSQGWNPFDDTDAPSISADGSWVAFSSLADNLVPGDTNGAADVFVKNSTTGEIERVSVSWDGKEATGQASFADYRGSFKPKITPNGQQIVFESYATNLVEGDTNGMKDIFVHDRSSGKTERVSVKSDGNQVPYPYPPQSSAIWDAGTSPSISDAGDRVVFVSRSALDPADINDMHDIYLWERSTGKTRLISKAIDGSIGSIDTGSGGTDCSAPAISGDGTRVAFASGFSNLRGSGLDTRGDVNVFLGDPSTGCVLERVSLTNQGRESAARSDSPVLSRDGRFIAFISFADLDGTGEAQSAAQVYMWDLSTKQSILISVSNGGIRASRNCLNVSISSNGLFVVFDTEAANLVDGDTNQAKDVFLRDLSSSHTIRVSVNTFNEQTQGNLVVEGLVSPTIFREGSWSGAISADGRFVAFASKATNLVVDDSNDLQDVFVRGPLR